MNTYSIFGLISPVIAFFSFFYLGWNGFLEDILGDTIISTLIMTISFHGILVFGIISSIYGAYKVWNKKSRPGYGLIRKIAALLPVLFSIVVVGFFVAFLAAWSGWS